MSFVASGSSASNARGSFQGNPPSAARPSPPQSASYPQSANPKRAPRESASAPPLDARSVRGRKPGWKKGPRADAQKTPDPILFQTYFKSVGPRTYAAQLKRAGNGNQYLVFTEGKRDKVTDEVRKTSLYVFSEDFVSFFKLLKETAEYVKAHPLSAEMVQKRARFWQKQNETPGTAKPGNKGA